MSERQNQSTSADAPWLEPCPTCGAAPGADHTQGCNFLGAIRAQAYPELIDQNGMAWYTNALRRKDAEIINLRALVTRLTNVVENLAGELSDPGTEALAAVHCGRNFIYG